MQRNWIGKSEGLRFSFVLEDEAGNQLDDTLTVCTTRHDTIFGASFCAISADHALTQKAAEHSDTIKAFREIVDGKHDELPEQAFYMCGGIEDVIENADRMAKV